MKNKIPIVDTIQIAGFVVSISVSIGLIFAGQETIPSLILGLALVIITQLFDLQLRHNASEERLLKAGLLNIDLYRNEWLLTQIQHIVESYFSTKADGFELFETRANDAIAECQHILHNLADGYMTAPHKTKFTYGRGSIRNAKKTVKATVYINPSYFRTSYGRDFLKVNEDALKRGVKITRIWVQRLDTIIEYRDILEKQQSIGMDVLVVLVDAIPLALHEDYIITDDKVLVKSEPDIDGLIQNERISIKKSDVTEAVSNFELLKRYAHSLEEIYNSSSPQ